ncbi:hypothetical protein [Porphyrobacter sp. ULC335]|uniref:hypothetical protein n=1 Tax=Porphyrobacter sp. ULC335 TaxID=2854260 RepID=UPI00221F7888|nr:hypothetical protein [Porphyrobacter sp. ULC335]UYV15801.1 hypothetical protein KVF90_00100 [Porphyrobacter sp. ULC335]
MKSLTKLMLAVAATLALPAVPLGAQNTSQVALTGDVKAVKVVTDADGKERTELVDPTTIVPGDRLVFGTDYANKGADAVTNFTVTNPLPAAVRLSPEADPALELSVDGGKTWGVLGALTIANSDGTSRPATHADVTHVRWVLASIAPGASGRLTYPAIIR